MTEVRQHVEDNYLNKINMLWYNIPYTMFVHTAVLVGMHVIFQTCVPAGTAVSMHTAFTVGKRLKDMITHRGARRNVEK